MKSFRYEDDSDELIKVDHATLQRLSDLNYWAYSDALEAMQRDLEIVPLPEERQGERQGGDDQ